MARLKSRLFLQVAGSSLVEVITAMIIISMIFGFSVMIYLNVQRTGISSVALRARHRINDVLIETTVSQRYENAEKVYDDGVVVYQEVKNFQGNEYLWHIHLEARDGAGKLIAERNRLVYAQKP